jgi:hypothetical protein
MVEQLLSIKIEKNNLYLFNFIINHNTIMMKYILVLLTVFTISNCIHYIQLPFDGQIEDITYFNNTYYVVGNFEEDPIIYSSTDMIKWSNNTIYSEQNLFGNYLLTVSNLKNGIVTSGLMSQTNITDFLFTNNEWIEIDTEYSNTFGYFFPSSIPLDDFVLLSGTYWNNYKIYNGLMKTSDGIHFEFIKWINNLIPLDLDYCNDYVYMVGGKKLSLVDFIFHNHYPSGIITRAPSDNLNKQEVLVESYDYKFTAISLTNKNDVWVIAKNDTMYYLLRLTPDDDYKVITTDNELTKLLVHDSYVYVIGFDYNNYQGIIYEISIENNDYKIIYQQDYVIFRNIKVLNNQILVVGYDNFGGKMDSYIIC